MRAGYSHSKQENIKTSEINHNIVENIFSYYYNTSSNCVAVDMLNTLF